eukprot:PLAT6611.1.p2 GENE.PLAT6611.1~~PLAT6611.1.p2  ORF type:complete len:419 (+),score=209.41 PLAT6611.1:18-1274(+)
MTGMLRAILPIFSILSAQLLLLSARPAAAVPGQVHLERAGPTEDKMVVSWASAAKTSTVWWGTASGVYSANDTVDGKMYSFPLDYSSPYIHHATIGPLKPATRYYFYTGDLTSGFSREFSFLTGAGGIATRFAVLGDHGHTEDSQQTLDRLRAEHEAKPYDVLIHAGDISYANARMHIWDTYETMIEPVAATLPWMAVPGNHEYVEVPLLGPLPNLVAYRTRFRNPNPSDNANYFSFNQGGVHFIGLNSEDSNDKFDADSAQRKWLAADLAAAAKARAQQPWIVVYFHRPWYSSNHVHGNDTLMRDALEPMFQQYGVNVVVSGHIHAYERTRPLHFGDVVEAGSEQHGIVYLTVGNGGNGEGLYHSWEEPQPPLSAARASEFGHVRFEVHNATHAHMEMLLSVNETIADSAWIIRSDA